MLLIEFMYFSSLIPCPNGSILQPRKSLVNVLFAISLIYLNTRNPIMVLDQCSDQSPDQE